MLLYQANIELVTFEKLKLPERYEAVDTDTTDANEAVIAKDELIDADAHEADVAVPLPLTQLELIAQIDALAQDEDIEPAPFAAHEELIAHDAVPINEALIGTLAVILPLKAYR